MIEKKTKNEEEITVKEKLYAITQLQKALSDIDKIRILRGELPLEVQDIEDDIKGTQTRLDNISAAAKALTHSITSEKHKVANAKDLLDKYRRQLDHVRNNREYDNLSKEIEYQDLESQLSEKKIREYTEELARRKEEIAQLKEKIELRQGDLAQKESELGCIIKETHGEEERLLERAKVLEEKIKDKRLLAGFQRIRNATHNGLAVVPIDRDACGGCFNRIPPQRQLEVRIAKKVTICEYCGRIIVDPDFFLDEDEKKAVDETSKAAKEGVVSSKSKQLKNNVESVDGGKKTRKTASTDDPATKKKASVKRATAKKNTTKKDKGGAEASQKTELEE